jgi:hypothetical protein
MEVCRYGLMDVQFGILLMRCSRAHRYGDIFTYLGGLHADVVNTIHMDLPGICIRIDLHTVLPIYRSRRAGCSRKKCIGQSGDVDLGKSLLASGMAID